MERKPSKLASASVWSEMCIVAMHLLSVLLMAVLCNGAHGQKFFAMTSTPKPDRIRYRARVAYDGSSFNGWQVQNFQNSARTIQGELEGALSRRFNRTVKVVGAGRTDAGVHARGQAFHFDLYEGEAESADDIQRVQTSLNSMLTRDIRVWNLQIAPPPMFMLAPNGNSTAYPWHAIHQAEKKLYTYRFCAAASMDPRLRHTRHHVDWGNLDLDRLAKVLRLYEGTHDFRAFAAAIEHDEKLTGRPKSTVRTVYSVDLVDEGHGLYRVDFLLKGALYKMVRSMMGTAIDVCRGRIDEATFLQLLYHGGAFNDERTCQFVRDDNPSKPSPPQGLTLERVFYEGDF